MTNSFPSLGAGSKMGMFIQSAQSHQPRAEASSRQVLMFVSLK